MACHLIATSITASLNISTLYKSGWQITTYFVVKSIIKWLLKIQQSYSLNSIILKIFDIIAKQQNSIKLFKVNTCTKSSTKYTIKCMTLNKAMSLEKRKIMNLNKCIKTIATS